MKWHPHHQPLSLPAKLALFFLGPSLFVSILFSIFFVNAKVEDVEESLKRQGTNVLLHLSPEAHRDILKGDIIPLERAVFTTQKYFPFIASVTLTDPQGIRRLGPDIPFSIDELNENFNALSPSKGQEGSEVVIVEDEKSFYFITRLDDIDGPHYFGYLTLRIPTQYAHKFEEKARLTAFVLIGLIFISYLLLSILLYQYLSRPLNSILNAAKAIQKGHYDSKVEFKSFSELMLLQETWNQMTESLAHTTESLQQKIKEATHELVLKNQELELAKEKALEGERAKADFLANMSHEIRTPLSAMTGFAELLLEDETISARQRHPLEIIHHSTRNLLNIVNDILDFSKIEAQKLSLRRENFELRPFLEEILITFSPEAHLKKLPLCLQIYPDVPEKMNSDPLRLRQILMNLVGNALKFTDQGSILLRVSLNESGWIQFEIKDTGIGLSLENQKKLFQAFSQADNSSTRRHGGTGLGLIICQKLTTLLEGEIGMESEEGSGSVFWIKFPPQIQDFEIQDSTPFSLPSKKIAVLYHPLSVVRLSLLQSLEKLNFSVISCQSPEALLESLAENPNIESFLIPMDFPFKLPSEHSAQGILMGAESTLSLEKRSNNFGIPLKILSLPYTENQLKACLNLREENPFAKIEIATNNPSPISVLVVDDHPDTLSLTLARLKKYGLQATAVSNGKAALEWLNHHSVEVIFMDLQMPGMDGFETAQCIRTQHPHSPVRIYALTADITERENQKILDSGMNGYYLKPLSHQDLSELFGSPAQAETPLDDLTQKQLESLPAFLQELNDALEKNDSDKTLQLIHKLHGGLCFTTLATLKSLAKSAEKALKTKGSIELAQTEIQALIKEIQRRS